MFRRIVELIEGYRVTSTLLFMSVTGVLGFLVSLLVRPLEREDLLAAITSIVSYVGGSVSLSRWTFAVLLVVALVGIMFLGSPIVDWVRELREKRPEPPAPLPRFSYTEDTIDGVLWRWEWAGNSSSPYKPVPYCTKCDYELEVKRTERHVDSFKLCCARCASPRSSRPASRIGSLAEHAKLEIERRARKIDKGEEIS